MLDAGSVRLKPCEEAGTDIADPKERKEHSAMRDKTVNRAILDGIFQERLYARGSDAENGGNV